MPGARRDHERLFVYRGRSMWPTFLDGDVLVVGLRRAPRRGDCAVFALRPGESPTVHRVVGVLPDGRRFVTRGDAHRELDDRPVPRALIIGVVTGRIRYGREARVHGSVAGRLSCGAHRLGGRLEPSRDSRGGRVGRALRAVARPVARRIIMPRLRYERRGDGVKGALAMFGGRVVGVSATDVSELQVVWPWTLLAAPADLVAHASPRRAARG